MAEQPDDPGGRRATAEMSLDELALQLVGLARRLAAGTYELLVMVGELDARDGWARWGALSCAAWLAELCDVEPSTARTQVRVARAMRTFPLLDAAMRSGEVSYAKARVLVPHLTQESEGPLVEIASRTPSSRLGIAIAAWAAGNEPDEDRARRHRREQWLASRTDADGMVTVTVRLPPEQGQAVCAMVDQQVLSGEGTDGASLAHQRADALVALVTGGGGSVTTEVVIHVRGDDPTTLADGTPVSDHTVAGLLDESFIRLLMHDAERRPIDASPRRRTPTVRQRRVLDERHPECAHDGCHARVLLQYDHVVPYAAGGLTVLENLQRMCGPHNRARGRVAGGPP